jgi:hypothetical protein
MRGKRPFLARFVREVSALGRGSDQRTFCMGQEHTFPSPLATANKEFFEAGTRFGVQVLPSYRGSSQAMRARPRSRAASVNRLFATVVRCHRGIQSRVEVSPAVRARIYSTGGNTGASEKPGSLRRLHLIWGATALNKQSACRKSHRQRTGAHHRNDSHDPPFRFGNSSIYCSTRWLKAFLTCFKKIGNECAINA